MLKILKILSSSKVFKIPISNKNLFKIYFILKILKDLTFETLVPD